MTPTEKAILKTILYFDVFDYPLTEEQLLFYLMEVKTSRKALRQSLQTAAMTALLEARGSYWFVRGRGSLVTARSRMEQQASALWTMAARSAARIRHLPFVRGIYLSGDLSKGVAGHDSDIDFFIITAGRRVWVCKVALAIFRRIPGFNPRKLLCFNYLLSEDHLELEDKTLYTAAEVTGLAPLYGLQLFQRFMQKNRWVAVFFPNYYLAPNPNHCIFHGASGLQKVLEWPLKNILIDGLEALLPKIWKTVWGWRYRKDTPTRDALLRGICERYSKSHGYPTEGEVLEAYAERLQAKEI